MNKLTAIVTCYNNEDILRDCLESVKWADEILVCDSFSTDNTLAIARQYTDRIVQHEYIRPALQKNWAIPQARYDWILFVDTDEIVSEELKREIISLLQNPGRFDGFKIPRANYSLGKRLKYGGYWPDYQLRLFRKSKGIYELREVHEHVILNGNIGYLQNPIIHKPDHSVEQIIEKFFLRYARWEAEERLKREQPNILKLLFLPPAVFIYRYIWLKGFLDGRAGFIAAMVWLIYIFFTYLYMWQWKEKE